VGRRAEEKTRESEVRLLGGTTTTTTCETTQDHPHHRKERHVRTYPLDAIDEAANDADGSVRPDGYSGRGMYGKTCASVSFRSLSDAFRFFARLGEFTAVNAADDSGMDDDASVRLPDLMESVETDTMGLGLIAYFPGWTFV
jgi:hypothetical protein